MAKQQPKPFFSHLQGARGMHAKGTDFDLFGICIETTGCSGCKQRYAPGANSPVLKTLPDMLSAVLAGLLNDGRFHLKPREKSSS